MSSERPRRFRVVGTSGAGKSTLARAIASRLGLAYLELDSIHHLPGWQPAPPEVFRSSLERFLDAAGGGWVIDGNYRSHAPGLDALADVVVWVDPSRAVVMARVVRRTLRRGLLREELWNGNREELRNLLRTEPDENIVLWSWRTFAPNRERYAVDAAGDERWVRLRSRGDARRWLASLG